MRVLQHKKIYNIVSKLDWRMKIFIFHWSEISNSGPGRSLIWALSGFRENQSPRGKEKEVILPRIRSQTVRSQNLCTSISLFQQIPFQIQFYFFHGPTQLPQLVLYDLIFIVRYCGGKSEGWMSSSCYLILNFWTGLDYIFDFGLGLVNNVIMSFKCRLSLSYSLSHASWSSVPISSTTSLQ